MEKARFNFLVNHFNSLTQAETAELRTEQDHYSYCQLLHNLIARGDQDNQTEMKELSLTMAAVYATDRTVLKYIMTEPRGERAAELQTEWHVTTPIAQPVEEQQKPNEVTTETSLVETVEIVKPTELETQDLPAKADLGIGTDENFDPEAALQAFIADLAPMRAQKLKFEQALDEFEKHKNEVPAKPEKAKRKAKGAKGENEHLLEEIKTSKKKLDPDSPKQIEQLEIIDQFIKSKPAIPKASTAQIELDLTQGTDTYNDNVVSETLALILIKQGKKEKAVEVLRKLIWKFPQKKAYFAAQIEDLLK